MPDNSDPTAQRYEPAQDVIDLQAHPRNPRRGDVDAIRDSIRRNGFFGVIIAQEETGYVLAGNHRLQAAKAEGITHVPTMWVSCDDDTAARILLADNRANDLAVYDDSELLSLLSEFDMGDLEGTGWRESDLDELERIVAAANTDAPIQIPADIEPDWSQEDDDDGEIDSPPDNQAQKEIRCSNCGYTIS